MKRRLLVSLIGILVISIGGLITNLAIKNKPLLGLDLQGGASVTLRPVYGDPDKAAMEEVVRLYRARIESLNIGEAEVIRQGNTIVVNLPGVKDQDRALRLIGTTGKVTFRPVLARQGGFQGLTVPLSATGPKGASGATGAIGPAPTTSVAGSSAATTSVSPPTAAPSTTAANGPGRFVSQATTTAVPATSSAPSTSVPAATTTATAGATGPNTGSASGPTGASGPTITEVPTTTVPLDPDCPTLNDLTPADKDLGKCKVLLPDRNGTVVYELGPVFAQGENAVESAQAEIDRATGYWQVSLKLKAGEKGLGAWNAAASECYSRAPSCTEGGMAIIIDHQVISAPTPQQPSFDTGDIRITGNFGQEEASNISRVLRYGATPVEMRAEESRTVSATLGKDSLRAGVISGIIGVGLVLLLMLLYYRRLALVVFAGLCVSGSIIWSAVSIFDNLFVLTLAGVTGIIVSIGVTVDSYVVFFERLKDEVRGGRSLRNSAQRGFTAAWRTILAADFVSLLGAVVLWYLSVGSVRGFALFLGLSTACDMVVAWFFTRPAIILLSRWRFFQRGKVLGVTMGEESEFAGGAK